MALLIHASVILSLFLIITAIMVGPVAAQQTTITLERGMCFGTCPVYTLTLSSNGTVLYDGQMYVKETGNRTGTISSSDFSSLISSFEEAGFDQLRDEYLAYNITDMPSAVLIVQDGNMTRRVDHYHGDMSAPKILTDLEDLVDKAANSSQWITPYTPDSLVRDEI